MRVGVPKEVKSHENRVGLVPAAAEEFDHHGHQVIVESEAGREIGFSDDDYRAAGAEIAPDAKVVFATADMIVKVKEPEPAEVDMMRPGQILFTYLHLAADRRLSEGLMRSGATCIAYETVTDSYGGLPLLAPMSEVAGRMSIQVGAHCLEKEQGGVRHSPRRRDRSRTRQDRDLGRRRIRHPCCAHGDGDGSFCDRDRQIAPPIERTRHAIRCEVADLVCDRSNH
jgi:alanine dehydrogenase